MLISLRSLFRKYFLGLAFIALLVATAIIFYNKGYDYAELKKDKEISELKAEYSSAREKQALNVAIVEKYNREKLELANARAFEADKKFQEAETARILAEKKLSAKDKEVSDVALATCSGMPSSWVRQYNEYIQSGSSKYTHSYQGCEATNSSEPFTKACGLTPFAPGVQQDELTTPEDILAHGKDLFGICKKSINQLNDLINLVGQDEF